MDDEKNLARSAASRQAIGIYSAAGRFQQALGSSPGPSETPKRCRNLGKYMGNIWEMLGKCWEILLKSGFKRNIWEWLVEWDLASYK
jgi:hypothetical protein